MCMSTIISIPISIYILRESWKDSTVGKTLVLHMAGPSCFSNTPELLLE